MVWSFTSPPGQCRGRLVLAKELADNTQVPYTPRSSDMHDSTFPPVPKRQLTPDYRLAVPNPLVIDTLDGAGHHYVYMLGIVVPDPNEPGETEVLIIYVGVTSNLQSRMRSHQRKWWWSVINYYELIEYPTRARAEEIERSQIRQFQPQMNRAGRLLVVTDS